MGTQPSRMITSVAIVYTLYKLLRFLNTDCDLALASCSLPAGAYKGKVVWITGASSGIGEALALRLSQLGAKLVLSSRRKEALEAVKAKCAEPANVAVVPLDLSDLDSLPAKAEEALKQFGSIDILVNNGGVSTRCLAHEAEFSVDQKVMQVDYFGQIRVTKALLPHFMERGSADIINISSVAGKIGGPMRSAYSGAKFALLGWMDSLRMEMAGVGKDIRVCNICPGPVATNVATNALKSDGSKFAQRDPLIDNGIKVVRCAELILIANANRRTEVWIAKHPILFFTYVSQYMPGVALGMAKKQAPKMIGGYRK